MVIYFFLQNTHLNIAEERKSRRRFFIVNVQFTMKFREGKSVPQPS